MDMAFKETFSDRWARYFTGADLPLVFYYTDRDDRAERAKAPEGWECIIASLNRVRQGTSLCFDVDAVGCGGGKRYLGFVEKLRPNFEYFLSCGIPGELEGERYKKSPELVETIMAKMPIFKAPGRFIVFKRWDRIDPGDEPAVVIFFAPPDVLSGLFTLANFDEQEHAVYTPFGAGCGTIVQYPFLERAAARPRAVLGMFDVSARPGVPSGTLSFAVPWSKFVTMVENMPESFLITPSWEKVRKRIGKHG
ncbi:MAG: DUF169 domain-containing protein [Deltaproteobacteria bacterium]|nr:DUF169 domain-containing protein [Deltaproteobacteria bacterium]